MTALRDTSDYFDEVDIMANAALGGSTARKKPHVEQVAAPTRQLGSKPIDSTCALDTFLNDILNLGDAATVAAAAAAGLPGSHPEQSDDDEFDRATMSVLERRRARRPKDPEKMNELVRKLLADWSRNAGVMGVICVNTDGRVVLTDMQDNVAREMAGRFHQLMPMVRKSIKQIDADDDLELMRFRTQNYEVLATSENEYTMLIVSNPRAWRTLLKDNNANNVDRRTLSVNERLLHKGIFKILEAWKRQREMKQAQQQQQQQQQQQHQ